MSDEERPPVDVVVQPATGSVSQADADALKLIQQYRSGELPRLQQRAERWIGGLTALTGVLTAAIVVKGPETFAELVDSREFFGRALDPKDLIIGLMLFGGIALAAGIWWSYSAAHGDPLSRQGLEELAKNPLASAEGASEKWRVAVIASTAQARQALERGAAATILGVALLASAVFLTWTTKERPEQTTSTCILGSDGQPVTLEGGVPTVTDGQLTVVPCAD